MATAADRWRRQTGASGRASISQRSVGGEDCRRRGWGVERGRMATEEREQSVGGSSGHRRGGCRRLDSTAGESDTSGRRPGNSCGEFGAEPGQSRPPRRAGALLQGALSPGGWEAVRAYWPERRHRPRRHYRLLSTRCGGCRQLPAPPSSPSHVRGAAGGDDSSGGAARQRAVASGGRSSERQPTGRGRRGDARRRVSRHPPSHAHRHSHRLRSRPRRRGVARRVASRRHQWQHRDWGAQHPPAPYVLTDPCKACQLDVAWLQGCCPRRRSPPPPPKANQRDGRANDPLLPSLAPPTLVPAREGGGGGEGGRGRRRRHARPVGGVPP